MGQPSVLSVPRLAGVSVPSVLNTPCPRVYPRREQKRLAIAMGKGQPLGKHGTGGGNRTHKGFRPPDFESSASANSATPALLRGEAGDTIPSCGGISTRDYEAVDCRGVNFPGRDSGEWSGVSTGVLAEFR